MYFSLVTEGILLSNLGSKNNPLIEVHRALLLWVSNVITFWSRYNDKSLYLQLGGHRGYIHRWRTLKLSSSSCFKCFVVIKFSKFCKKDKCSLGRWPVCRLLYLYMKQSSSNKSNLSINFLFLKIPFCWGLLMVKLQAFRTVARLIF